MKKAIRLIIFLVFVFVILFLFLRFIKIQKIICTSQYGNCDTTLETSINNLQNKNENFIQTYFDLKNILKNSKSILNYRVDLVLPFDFKVNVISRTAIVAFSLKDGNFGLIDGNGVLISEVRDTNLPKIISYYNPTSDQLDFIANLVSRIYTLYTPTQTKVMSDGIYFENLKGKTVIFPMDGDQDELIGSLNIIFSRLPSIKEASTISQIDLRYKNPVLR